MLLIFDSYGYGCEMKTVHESVGTDGQTVASPSPEVVLEQLRQIRLSEMFSGASRLVDLLDYIVKQNLTDPSRKILAKTIAEDLYGRTPDRDGDNHNIVRVDAGRLRRRLAEFYAGPGQDDPVIIHIAPGGYVPRYELRQHPQSIDDSTRAHRTSPHKSWRALIPVSAAVFASLIIGFGLGVVFFSEDQSAVSSVHQKENSGDPKLEAERRARLAKSPSSLQAVTLSDHARNLIFPMFERRQLELSLAMFRQAIAKDSLYFGGYAGAAQSLAALAIFLPESTVKSNLLDEARDMVDQAEALSPANSWTQSALSWVLFVEGNIVQAKEHANIAIDLAPTDGNVLDFYALIMLSVGDLEASSKASNSSRKRTSGLGRFANRSIFGASSFHMGMYQESVDALIAATTAGDPISAPTLAYLAASNQRLGNTAKAKHYAADLVENWPAFDPQLFLSRLYVNPDQVTDLTATLSEAGWASSAPTMPDAVRNE